MGTKIRSLPSVSFKILLCYFCTIMWINLVSLSTSLTVLKITHLLLQNIPILAFQRIFKCSDLAPRD